MEDWLTIRGKSPGPLLCPVRKGGSVELRHFTAQVVLLIVQKRANVAGVAAFSPHDFRRTFCSDLLDSGTDIVTVQKLAGHTSPVTTAKYDWRGEETKRKAVLELSRKGYHWSRISDLSLLGWRCESLPAVPFLPVASYPDTECMWPDGFSLANCVAPDNFY